MIDATENHEYRGRLQFQGALCVPGEVAMTKTRRVSTTCALIVCLLGAQMSGTLFAEETPTEAAPASSSVVSASPPLSAETSAFSAPFSPFASGPSHFVLSNQELAALAAPPQLWRGSLNAIPVEATSLAQRGYRGRRSGGRNGGAAAAIIVGAAATIAGSAVLVYANRPECRTNRISSGCGYGTKVIGGSVLAGGLVGVVVGAATWR
jgi:hypothetical protein